MARAMVMATALVMATAMVKLILSEVATLSSVTLSYAAIVCSIVAMPAFAAMFQRCHCLQCCWCPHSHVYQYARLPLLTAMKRVMAMATRVSGQAMTTATKRAMATAMRVAGNKEGYGNIGKSNGNGIKGGRRSTATTAMATRVVAEQW